MIGFPKTTYSIPEKESWVAYDCTNENDESEVEFCRGEELDYTFKPHEIATILNLYECALLGVIRGAIADQRNNSDVQLENVSEIAMDTLSKINKLEEQKRRAT